MHCCFCNSIKLRIRKCGYKIEIITIIKMILEVVTNLFNILISWHNKINCGHLGHWFSFGIDQQMESNKFSFELLVWK